MNKKYTSEYIAKKSANIIGRITTLVIEAFFVMILWNYLFSTTWNLIEINYLQTFALMILIRLIMPASTTSCNLSFGSKK